MTYERLRSSDWRPLLLVVTQIASAAVIVAAAKLPVLALARCALVVGVLPGATAVVDDASVAARSGVTRNRERGAVCRRLSRTGIVLAARATIALLGHGIRAGYRWTLHLPAVYFAVQALASLTLVYPTFSASED